MTSRWFGSREIGPGTEIKLSKRWRVLSILSEHVLQHTEEQQEANPPVPSRACIRLLVQQVGSRPLAQAHMRIYKQIPTFETEAEPPAIRAQRAQSFTPGELEALRTFTRESSTITPLLLDSKEAKQDDHSFVPGGFVVWIVWNLVPGVRLDDGLGSAGFWAMERSKRDQIREAFKENYMQLTRWGYRPLFPGSKKLVWDPDTSTLYIIGYFMPTQITTPQQWNDAKYIGFGLAKMPKYGNFSWATWNGSTEGWQW